MKTLDVIESVKERPILFSTPMVKAIMPNRKTVTRRTTGLDLINQNPDDWEFNWFDYQVGYCFNQKSTLTPAKLIANTFNQEVVKCPYGFKGDILWVRETWTDEINGKENYYPFFKADFPMSWDDDGYIHTLEETDLKWKPSIFMPKLICRLRLKITSIRVERLHDITLSDATKEGIEVRQFSLYGLDEEGRNEVGRIHFGNLWKSINGAESWGTNPWVWRIEFSKLGEKIEPTKQI